MKHVRIALEEQEFGEPLCFDTVLDDCNQVAHQIPFAGWWGKIKSNDMLPVVFQPNGVMRLASEPEDDFSEVHYKMNIFNVALELGSSIEMIDPEDGDTVRYVVKKILNLHDLTNY